ncbi:MAG: 50S ribosomal protein L25/general stress protein Ctc [Candidatus Thiosymbion ectosymbiont of Robbea hypermnestra]|nr:50S ribosomal protein L25/general stress protein Ctc [Candidatus Thiosymbion ectosymbiont of Robbea hypermnestra]
MSASFEINAQPRRDAGKGASRRLRRQGLVPAIVYGGEHKPEMINLVHNELVRNLEREGFYSQVLDLKTPDKTEQVVVKDVQRHPAKPFILHLDFQRISAVEKLRMAIPLHFLNEDSAKGVKAGGMVSRKLTEIEVICLPKDLPRSIEIDLLEMAIGDAVHLSQVLLPEGVVLAHAPDPDVPVVAVQSIQVREEEEDLEAEDGEGEGAESAEPEES